MSIRNLDCLFDPASVAVVGATDRPASVGATVWRNLRAGGFPGPVWPVNPQRTHVDGEPCYAYVSALPAAPDLAVVCTPAAVVPGVIEELGQRGTRAAVVLTAGLDERTRQAMLDAARTHLLRILGPNCLGLLAPHAKLNATFAHVGAEPGTIAFVSQSGALVTAILDWARGRGIGFSHFVSLGEHADVDFGDMIDWLASDARTRAILLYVESVESPRKFMSAARAAARNKPVVVVKAGRTRAGQAAAASHTGALAGSDLVYDAAIRRAGMLRVDTIEDLFVAAETLAHFRGPLRPAGDAAIDALTIVTNGGGVGVMAADAAAQAGLNLVPLSEATRAALDAALPAHWSRANPVDIIGDAPVERYVRTFETLLADPAAGTLLFLHAPTAIVPSPRIAQALVPVLPQSPRRVLSSWVGGPGLDEARRIFHAAGVPTYDTPEEAVRAFSFIVDYRRNQELLMQAPPARAAGAGALDARAVGAIVERVLAEGRELLTEPEAKTLLAAAGVPVVGVRVAGPDPEDAARAAAEVGMPVALKILSPDITHKSDVGGVALDLEDADAVRTAAAAILRRAQRLKPEARIAGFSVQPMVRRPRALELIVGASVDPVFGPVILFGQGGVAVEVLADRAIALPPLNVPLARALVERTRVARLMKGYRDVPPVDEGAVLATLMAVSQLLADEPRIVEIDVNPLLADAGGAIALDARVRVRADAPGGAARFAIRPYPAELEESSEWNGRTLTLRPIRPEDEDQHRAFLAQLDPADIRMRIFYSRRTIERSELARLVQIDYEREMAFVATAAGADGREETLGVARAVCDPDNRDAEFGILVRSDVKGARLGRRLMHKLIDHLKARGTQRLVATVLRDNARMLELARNLGFAYDADPQDPTVWAVALPLR